MTLYVYIFEDQPVHAENLKKQINRWSSAHDCEVQISAHRNEADICKAMIEKADLFFLDIQLEEGNGLQVAHIIRSCNQTVPIVFLTNHRDYVFDGYHVQAFRYLLKPLTQSLCGTCMEQALCYAGAKQKRELLILLKGERIIIDTNQIVMIEAKGHYCDVVTQRRTITYLQNLYSIEETLPQECFVRSHRSFLVNVHHICAIQDNLLQLDNGLVAPISRGCRSSVIKALSDRIGVS